MAVDQQHRYSNKAERADSDIYDDFKFKKKLCFPWFIEKNVYSGINVKLMYNLINQLRLWIAHNFQVTKQGSKDYLFLPDSWTSETKCLLKLLTQFQATNKEKYLSWWKIDISNFELLD